MKYKAFIFDLNGTIIDDMAFHTRAWFQLLNNDLGADLSFEEVAAEMYGKNTELLHRVFGPNRFTEEEMAVISLKKEMLYQSEFRPHLKLINGLDSFLSIAGKQNIKMAIGTAAIPFNVDFVVDNLHIRHYFPAIITADDVRVSKPDGETFLKCADALGVPPAECLVFEDVPKGALAAQNAGMSTVIITTGHKPQEFGGLGNILFFIQDYNDPSLGELL